MMDTSIITALFKCVTELTLTGTFVAVLLILIRKLLPFKINARVYFILWAIPVFRYLVPFAVKSQLSIFNLANYFRAELPVSEAVNTTPVQSGAVVAVTEAVSKYSVSDIIWSLSAYIWAVGAVLILAYLIVNYISLIKQSNKLPECKDARALKMFEQAKVNMGVREDVPVVIFGNSHSPSLMGLFKHKVLISLNVINSLSDEELLYVFMHELSHLKRGDIIWSFIIKIMCAIHWANPFVWYINGKIHQDIELACDAKVLTVLNNEDKYIDYGNTIIKLVAYFSKARPIMGATAVSGKKANIKQRIQMVSAYRRTKVFAKLFICTAAVVLGVLFLTDAMPVNLRAANNVLAGNEDNTGTLTAENDSYVDINAPDVVPPENNVERQEEVTNNSLRNQNVDRPTGNASSAGTSTGRGNSIPSADNAGIASGASDTPVAAENVNPPSAEQNNNAETAEPPTGNSYTQINGVQFDDENTSQSDGYLNITDITFE